MLTSLYSGGVRGTFGPFKTLRPIVKELRISRVERSSADDLLSVLLRQWAARLLAVGNKYLLN